MRYFMQDGTKVWVDDDDSCVQQHKRLDPPLFHLLRGNSAAAYLVRCPASLSESEQDRLDASSSGLEGSQKPERLSARGRGHPNKIGLPGANITKGTAR